MALSEVAPQALKKWEVKIEGNRLRDARNFRALRRGGWRVVRISEHRLSEICQVPLKSAGGLWARTFDFPGSCRSHQMNTVQKYLPGSGQDFSTVGA